jgi:hypothetical protein
MRFRIICAVVAIVACLVLPGAASADGPGRAHAAQAQSACYTGVEWVGRATNEYELDSPPGVFWTPFVGGGSAVVKILSNGEVALKLAETFESEERVLFSVRIRGSRVPIGFRHPVVVKRAVLEDGTTEPYNSQQEGSISMDTSGLITLNEVGSAVGPRESEAPVSDTEVGTFNCADGTMQLQSERGGTTFNLKAESLPVAGQVCFAGELPDPVCTQGGAAVTRLNPGFCRAGYSEGVRNRLLSARVLQNYGLTSQQTAGWQIDHLVPLGLGGTNAQVNLWPQADYLAKDNLERAARRWICGALYLPALRQEREARSRAAQQHAIRTQWLAGAELSEAQATFSTNWPAMAITLARWKQDGTR